MAYQKYLRVPRLIVFTDIPYMDFVDPSIMENVTTAERLKEVLFQDQIQSCCDSEECA